MTTKILAGVYGAAFDLTSPITTLSIAATGYLGAGVIAAGGGTYTVVNRGELKGDMTALSLAGAGVVTNAATIFQTNTTAGAGVMMGGGSVSNSATGRIDGYSGVAFITEVSTLINNGAIVGSRGDGVDLADGGKVVNGSTLATDALLQGGTAVAAGAAVSVANFGTVLGTGTAGTGGYLTGGGSVTNGSAGDVTALFEGRLVGVEITTAKGTVTNFGTFLAAGVAVGLTGGGLVTNGTESDTAALIEGGGAGVASQNDAITVTNLGVIIGGYPTSLGAEGAVILTAGGVVTNGSATDKVAVMKGEIGILIQGAHGVVTNFATIGGDQAVVGAAVTYGGMITNGSAADTTALIQGYIGAEAGNQGTITHRSTVRNYGTILGGRGNENVSNYVLSGVQIGGGGSVTNGSAADTLALISGEVGVYVGNGALTGTVSNFGSIEGREAGVLLGDGGRVQNGATSVTSAVIEGALVGVILESVAGTVSNFGTVRGGLVGGFGVELRAGGSLVNGASGHATGLVTGDYGVSLGAAGLIVNWASITGGAIPNGFGVSMSYKGVLKNEAGATIGGYLGVAAGTLSTIDNYGTIATFASDGAGVRLTDATARLNAEAGSVITGEVGAGLGVVDVVGGVTTMGGLNTNGKVMGAGALSLNGGASYFEAGASLLVARIDESGAATTVEIATILTDSRVWSQTGGTLDVDAGQKITFTGTANRFSGTISGSGAVVLSGGSDTLSNVAISTGKTTINKAAVTFAGTVGIVGTVKATSASLTVAAGGATLSGGGELLLSNTATNSLHGASAGATLTNADTIRGAGHLGGGVMTLVNAAGGLIEGVGSAGLFIDTGTNTITNAGTIEALTGDVTTIAGAVANTGLLASAGGTLVAVGRVSGTGSVKVSGGVVSFASTFNEAVAFGASGRLILAHSQSYAASLTGFSHTGTTSLDLQDIRFATATSSFSGTTVSGILTVTDGTRTAHIHLTGNYTAATWTLSNDGSGGTVVVDPTATRAHAIVSAAAGMGISSVVSAPSHAPLAAAPLLLASH